VCWLWCPRPTATASCIRDEHIDPAPFLDDPRYHCLDRLVATDIDLDNQSERSIFVFSPCERVSIEPRPQRVSVSQKLSLSVEETTHAVSAQAPAFSLPDAVASIDSMVLPSEEGQSFRTASVPSASPLSCAPAGDEIQRWPGRDRKDELISLTSEERRARPHIRAIVARSPALGPNLLRGSAYRDVRL